jgi:parallel beta helix pectate lyase-like protein
MKAVPLFPFFLFLTLPWADGATLTVTTTNDSGPGSLRDAITTANATSEADVIVFDLPGSAPRLVSLVTALPVLTGSISIINDRPGDQPVTVQRSSEPGTLKFRIFDISAATTTLSGLTISNGSANDSGGGGIHVVSYSTLTVRRCTITGNVGPWGGGGIEDYSANLNLIDCSISNNSVGDGQRGGGIEVFSSGKTILTNCTISNNSAANGGGLYIASGGVDQGGELRVNNCTFSGNSARDSGGAIYDTIRNPDLVTVMNSTITGNVAGYKAGGIIAYNGDAGAYLRLGNNIIAGNTCDNYYGDLYGHDLSPGLYVSDGHNIVGREATISLPVTTNGFFNGVKGDQIGTASNPIDPKLGPLQMNGGPTACHALLIGSPAINNGDDSFAPPHDQRGYGRVNTSDIGAVEFGGSYPRPLGNISTRGRVETGTNVLIAGFIVVGAEPKRVMIRVSGPSVDLPNRLMNPRLELWNSAGQLFAANDDWKQAGNRQEIVGSLLAPTNDAEPAILTTLTPGAYTAVVNGVDNDIGIAVVEVYDLGGNAESRLGNISTRGLVRSGDDDVMIGGFIVTGNAAQKVLIRALGPSLPLSDSLPNPTLELHDANGGVLRTNDDWRSDHPVDIEATGIPPADDRESAILISLSPASYTAIVRGANETVGIALVEIYEID